MVSETCAGSALDSTHVKHTYQLSVPAFNNGDPKPDAPKYVIQMDGDNYVRAQLPAQHLECSAKTTHSMGDSTFHPNTL